MENSSIIFLFFLSILLFQYSVSEPIVVDGVTEWRNSSVHIGDSLIFKHKNQYKLYIFKNRGAFDLCDFSQAILLTKPNSPSFTWNPSRPGFFYFTFNNGSLKTCEESEKLAIRVIPKPPENWNISPGISPEVAPAPTSGGTVSSSPAYHWHYISPQASSPSPAQSPRSPATIPSMLPDKGGGIPFINSNPAVPLPTGETDAAIIRPLPASSHGRQVVGLITVQFYLSCVLWLMLY